MPHTENPAGGAVATANNRPALDSEGPFLGIDWIDGYRAARIFESLEARQDWDVAGALALQMDQVSLPWREIRDLALDTPSKDDDVLEAIGLLKRWDGVMSADSPAATVFEFFLSEISMRIARAKAPRAYEWAVGMGFTPLIPHTFLTARRVGHLVRLLRDRPEGWFAQGWDNMVAHALAGAVKTLRKRYGEDHMRWAWGEVRTLTLSHPVGERALLRRVFNLGPFPWGGDANTVGQAAPVSTDPTVNPLAVASLRMVVDVGNWEESRFALPGGQSGNPISPHYEDLLPFWKRGDGVPIAWSPESVEEAARHTLRLLPAGRSAPHAPTE